jgi:hypothetical protein
MDWHSVLCGIWTFAKGVEWGTAVLGVASAFFGAWGAQRIISKKQEHDRLSVLIGNISTAITICLLISNRLFAAKRQHIDEMKSDYWAERGRYEDVELRGVKVTGEDKILKVDLQRLPEIRLPLNHLEDLAFNRLSLQGRALAAVTEVRSAIDLLNSMIEFRDEIIDEIKSAGGDQKKKLDIFFGQIADGEISGSEYSSIMENIDEYVDNGVYFSYILCEDLRVYGEAVRAKYKRYDLADLPKVDWAAAKSQHDFPDEADYKSWLDAFRTAE